MGESAREETPPQGSHAATTAPSAQGTKSEILMWRAGSFTVVRLGERVTPDSQSDFLRTLSSVEGDVALDLSRAAGVDLQLVQNLCAWTERRRAEGAHVALVRPPPRVLSLLEALDLVQQIPMAESEAELAKAKPQDTARELPLKQVEMLIRNQLASNVVWRFTDGEHKWLCPLCGSFPAGVLLHMPSRPDEACVREISLHLRLRCTGFNRPHPSCLPVDALEKIVARNNADHEETTRIQREKTRRKMEKLESLARRAETVEADLKDAAAYQRMLLPPVPTDQKGYEVSVSYQPCDAISGDFYDFVPMPDGRIAFVLGDVCGHGVQAGILMGMAKKVLRMHLTREKTPAAALRRANEDLVDELKRRSFVTALVGVFDPAGQRWTMLSAGHNPAILFRSTGSPVAVEIKPPGLLLGVAPDQRFGAILEPAEFDAREGDLLLFYSDGIVEARNAEMEPFDEDRLLAAVKEGAHGGPAEVLHRLRQALDAFTQGKPLQDDTTAVCVKVAAP
ncbi:MAG: SpoIIE family protein phosphatase [Planctomycetes bacterium]|nr:SpoIIE family protein phosphatase [Planctomycetota bacterium]